MEREQGILNLTVYAADGDPLLGGMDVDDELRTRLKYNGPPNLLRLAKEVVCSNPSSSSQNLPGGTTLNWLDVEAVLKEGKFIEKTLNVMMNVYRQAKLIWKRHTDGPPVGDILEQDSNGVIKRWVRHLREDDLARDVDKVLLFGGTTRISYIVQRLEDIFGPGKVVAASQLLPAFQEPELTAVALGAAYPPREQYMPLSINRLPCRVTLRIRQAPGEQKTEYTPFCRLLGSSYISETLAFDNIMSAEYEATIEDPDGGALHKTGWLSMHMPNFGAYANRIRVEIDRFGRIWIDMMTGRENEPFHDKVQVLEIPPWQTSAQRAALERVWNMQRQHEESERARTVYHITRNPFRWGEDVG